MSYSEPDTITDERFTPKHGPQHKTRIITARSKKKRYFDARGNEINQKDADIMADLAKGNSVVFYSEQKSGEEKPHVVRK